MLSQPYMALPLTTDFAAEFLLFCGVFAKIGFLLLFAWQKLFLVLCVLSGVLLVHLVTPPFIISKVGLQVNLVTMTCLYVHCCACVCSCCFLYDIADFLQHFEGRV